MSVVEAARIIRENENAQSSSSCDDGRKKIALWGVANPNDERSVERVYDKLEAGLIQGIITQPLLSSTAHETLRSYKTLAPRNNNNKDVTILAGLAFPRTARSLQFWAKNLLLDDQDNHNVLRNDPLFQSHLAFFSQPYYTPISWIGREFQELLMMTSLSFGMEEEDDDEGAKSASSSSSSSTTTTTPSPAPPIDGIHCMPLKNTEDLCTIFQSLNAKYTNNS
ncbi:MAG: hypothetical protein SGARI_006772 [Bacillariaceae sp.]